MTMAGAISAEWLLRHLDYLGVSLEVSGKNIRIFPAHKLTDAYCKAIKEHKPELLVLLRAKPSRPSPDAKAPRKLPETIYQKAEQVEAEECGCPVCHKPSSGNKTCPRCEADERERQRAFQSDYRRSNLRCDDPRLKWLVHVPVFPKR